MPLSAGLLVEASSGRLQQHPLCIFGTVLCHCALDATLCATRDQVLLCTGLAQIAIAQAPVPRDSVPRESKPREWVPRRFSLGLIGVEGGVAVSILVVAQLGTHSRPYWACAMGCMRLAVCLAANRCTQN